MATILQQTIEEFCDIQKNQIKPRSKQDECSLSVLLNVSLTQSQRIQLGYRLEKFFECYIAKLHQKVVCKYLDKKIGICICDHLFKIGMLSTLQKSRVILILIQRKFLE